VCAFIINLQESKKNQFIMKSQREELLDVNLSKLEVSTLVLTFLWEFIKYGWCCSEWL